MGKTSKVMTGVTTTALMLGLAGCGSESGASRSVSSIPAPPNNQHCDDWGWDHGDGVWECDDTGSSYFGHYYYGGHYYKNRSSLTKSNAYKNYKSSSSYKGGSKTSTGFGSGSKSHGG